MHRLLLALPLALSAAALFPATSTAEGPGTRIRSGSQMPRVPQSATPSKDDACARPRGESRGLCIQKESRESRRPVQTGDVAGRGSVSGTSGTGSSSSSSRR